MEKYKFNDLVGEDAKNCPTYMGVKEEEQVPEQPLFDPKQTKAVLWNDRVNQCWVSSQTADKANTCVRVMDKTTGKDLASNLCEMAKIKAMTPDVYFFLTKLVSRDS